MSIFKKSFFIMLSCFILFLVPVGGVFCQKLPDLVITDFAFEASRTNAWAGTISYTIQNAGTAAVPTTKIVNTYDVGDVMGATSTATITLAPGEKSPAITRSVSGHSTGTGGVNYYSIRISIDSSSLVTESSETNNSYSYRVTISKPDLTVDSITCTPSNPASGDQVTLSCKVSNMGGARVDPPIKVAYSVDNGSQYATDVTVVLNFPGGGAYAASLTLSPVWVPVNNSGSSATFNVHCVIDPAETVAEMIETNNSLDLAVSVLSGPVTITPEPTATANPPYSPEPVQPTPSTVLPGDVNGSGAIDIVDALLVAQYYVGSSPANFQTAMADVNKDGMIDIVDALRIAQCYVGLVSCSF